MKGRLLRGFLSEISIRMALLVVFLVTEQLPPFYREIQAEEMWLYKFHRVERDHVPTSLMFSVAVFTPLIVIVAFTSMKRAERGDVKEASLAVSLTLVLNGVFTNVIKLVVGRPRPDFFYRCFPDGHMNLELHCSGDPDVVMEGRKSFPSGHSSFAFAGLGFTALYIAGKLRCFNAAGQGRAWRLCVFLTPLLMAFWRRLSRLMSKLNPEPNLIHIMGCYVLGSANGEKLIQTLKRLMRPSSVEFKSPLELSAQGKDMIEMYFDFRLFRLWKSRQHSKLLDYDDLL